MLRQIILICAALAGAAHAGGSPMALSDVVAKRFDAGSLYVAADDMTRLCAVNTAYLALKMNGSARRYLDIYRALYPEETSRVSVDALRGYLESNGMPASFVRMSFEEMSERDGEFFIIYTPPPADSDIGHFSIARVFSGKVQIVDPPYASAFLDFEKTDKKRRVAVLAFSEGGHMHWKHMASFIAGSLLLCAAAAMFQPFRKHA